MRGFSHVLTNINRHSCGTYDSETDTGGSNGAGMRYEQEGGDPANAGTKVLGVFYCKKLCELSTSETCVKFSIHLESRHILRLLFDS